MLKISFDATRAFNNKTGLGNYSRHLILGLIQKFPEVQYHLFTTKINTDVSLFPINQQTSHLTVHQSLSKNKWFQSFWKTHLISNEISKLMPDIFHGLSNELPFNLPANVKKIVTIHDIIFKRFPELYPLIDRLGYDFKTRHAIKVADKIIAISQQTANDIVKFYQVPESKIIVHYQSCSPHFQIESNTFLTDDEKIKLNIPLVPYFLFLGTIEKRKNALIILKAYQKLENPPPLLIVGKKTAYQKELDEFLASPTIKNRNKINFIHDFPYQYLKNLYHHAIALIYPSQFEGFGIPIIESLFCGTPVITSQGSCFAEAGGPGCLYINPNNEEDLSDKINKLISDHSLKEKISQLGLSYVKENYSTEITTKRLMNIYRSLVN
jgi:glycosyltransferase involved in cell wall biosynthesis